MGLVRDFEFGHEKDIAMALLECDIACERAITDYNLADAVLGTYMEASESGTTGKFRATINAICKAIRSAIDTVINSLSNPFSSKEHINTNDFLDSETGQLTFKYDMDKAYAAINKELAEGNRLIGMLAKYTGKTPMEIDDYILSDHSKEQYLLRDSISAATAIKWYKKTCSKDALSGLKSHINRANKLADAIDNPLAQKKAIRIVNGMKHSVSDYIDMVSLAHSQIMRNQRKYNRKDD